MDVPATPYIYFEVGVLTKRLALAAFETPPKCTPGSDAVEAGLHHISSLVSSFQTTLRCNTLADTRSLEFLSVIYTAAESRIDPYSRTLDVDMAICVNLSCPPLGRLLTVNLEALDQGRRCSDICYSSG